MRFIGYSHKDENFFTWWFFQENRLRVKTFEGSRDGFIAMFQKNQIQICIELILDFLRMEEDVKSEKKRLHTYSENIEALRYFVGEASKNTWTADKTLLGAKKSAKIMKEICLELPTQSRKRNLMMFASKSCFETAILKIEI
jgi:phage regulator Rha-like protein